MAQFRAGSGSYQVVRQVTMQPSAITAASTSVETFTPAALADITNDSLVYVIGPALETGLAIVQSRITATGTVELTIMNFTGATVTPASQTFNVLVF